MTNMKISKNFRTGVVVLFFAAFGMIGIANVYGEAVGGASTVLTRQKLLKRYAEDGYKLILDKYHCVKNQKNEFFISEKIATAKDFTKARVLVICLANHKKSLQILSENKHIIYPETFAMSCS